MYIVMVYVNKLWFRACKGQDHYSHYLKRSCFPRKQLLAFVYLIQFSSVTSIFISTFMILLYLFKNAFVLSGSFVPRYGSSVPHYRSFVPHYRSSVPCNAFVFSELLLYFPNSFVLPDFLCTFQILSYFLNSSVLPKFFRKFYLS